MGTPHLPGMQYLTGGAMTIAAPNPEKNEADFSLAQIQFLSKKRTNWCSCHVISGKAFSRGELHFPGRPGPNQEEGLRERVRLPLWLRMVWRRVRVCRLALWAAGHG